jgi:hypothetical protein
LMPFNSATRWFTLSMSWIFILQVPAANGVRPSTHVSGVDASRM